MEIPMYKNVFFAQADNGSLWYLVVQSFGSPAVVLASDRLAPTVGMTRYSHIRFELTPTSLDQYERTQLADYRNYLQTIMPVGGRLEESDIIFDVFFFYASLEKGLAQRVISSLSFLLSLGDTEGEAEKDAVIDGLVKLVWQKKFTKLVNVASGWLYEIVSAEQANAVSCLIERRGKPGVPKPECLRQLEMIHAFRSAVNISAYRTKFSMLQLAKGR